LPHVDARSLPWTNTKSKAWIQRSGLRHDTSLLLHVAQKEVHSLTRRRPLAGPISRRYRVDLRTLIQKGALVPGVRTVLGRADVKLPYPTTAEPVMVEQLAPQTSRAQAVSRNPPLPRSQGHVIKESPCLCPTSPHECYRPQPSEGRHQARREDPCADKHRVARCHTTPTPDPLSQAGASAHVQHADLHG
jgi:hypothetical protein